MNRSGYIMRDQVHGLAPELSMKLPRRRKSATRLAVEIASFLLAMLSYLTALVLVA